MVEKFEKDLEGACAQGSHFERVGTATNSTSELAYCKAIHLEALLLKDIP